MPLIVPHWAKKDGRDDFQRSRSHPALTIMRFHQILESCKFLLVILQIRKDFQISVPSLCIIFAVLCCGTKTNSKNSSYWFSILSKPLQNLWDKFYCLHRTLSMPWVWDRENCLQVEGYPLGDDLQVLIKFFWMPHLITIVRIKQAERFMSPKLIYKSKILCILTSVKID